MEAQPDRVMEVIEVDMMLLSHRGCREYDSGDLHHGPTVPGALPVDHGAHPRNENKV